jgi:cytochrome c-type biogenesis protein CcmH/NrfF
VIEIIATEARCITCQQASIAEKLKYINARERFVRGQLP